MYAMLENDCITLGSLSGSRDEFISGIDDEELCRMYGFSYPPDGLRIFERFTGLHDAYGIFRQSDGKLVGFILSVNPELPDECQKNLPSNGRTLAYAIFPQYQRKGYMYSALNTLISNLFDEKEIDYIHCGRFDFNEKSARLLDKLGFEMFGTHCFKEKTIVDEILLKKKDEKSMDLT